MWATTRKRPSSCRSAAIATERWAKCLPLFMKRCYAASTLLNPMGLIDHFGKDAIKADERNPNTASGSQPKKRYSMRDVFGGILKFGVLAVLVSGLSTTLGVACFHEAVVFMPVFMPWWLVVGPPLIVVGGVFMTVYRSFRRAGDSALVVRTGASVVMMLALLMIGLWTFQIASMPWEMGDGQWKQTYGWCRDIYHASNSLVSRPFLAPIFGPLGLVDQNPESSGMKEPRKSLGGSTSKNSK